MQASNDKREIRKYNEVFQAFLYILFVPLPGHHPQLTSINFLLAFCCFAPRTASPWTKVFAFYQVPRGQHSYAMCAMNIC